MKSSQVFSDPPGSQDVSNLGDLSGGTAVMIAKHGDLEIEVLGTYLEDDSRRLSFSEDEHRQERANPKRT